MLLALAAMGRMGRGVGAVEWSSGEISGESWIGERRGEERKGQRRKSERGGGDRW